MNTYKDSDKTKEARKARYMEYLALHNIPFMSKKQVKRFNRLNRLRVLDNRLAYWQATTKNNDA